MLERHDLNEKVFESWQKNYEQTSLREAILALAGHVDPPTLDGVAAHQLLTLPSALSTREDAHLLLVLLNIESKRLPPIVYGQLFAECLYAFIRMQDWILCRQLLDLFCNDQSLETRLLRRNVQVWEYMFLAMRKSSGRDLWAAKPIYTQLIQAFCITFSPEADIEEFPTRDRPRRGPRPVIASTAELIFSRPDLVSAPMCTALLSLLTATDVPLTIALGQGILRCQAGNSAFPASALFDAIVQTALNDGGIKLFPRLKRSQLQEDVDASRSDHISDHLDSTITKSHLAYLQNQQLNFRRALYWYELLCEAISRGVKSEVPLAELQQAMMVICANHYRPDDEKWCDFQRTESYHQQAKTPEQQALQDFAIMHPLVRAKRWRDVISYWDARLQADHFQPSVRVLRFLILALLRLNRHEQAMAVTTWCGRKTISFSNYTLDSASPIPTLWPNRPPLHCTTATHGSVTLDANIMNLLLQDLVEREAWQDFYALWISLQGNQVFEGSQLDDESLAAFLRAGCLASARGGRSGSRVLHVLGGSKLRELQQQDDVWDGMPAWKKACELFEETLVATWPQYAEGPAAIEDPLKDAHGLQGMYKQGREWLVGTNRPAEVVKASPAPLPLAELANFGNDSPLSIIPSSAAFQEYIIVIGLFARSDRIPLTLAWLKAVTERDGLQAVDKTTITIAIILYEESGANMTELRALEVWLRSWMKESYPTESQLSFVHRWLNSGSIFDADGGRRP